MKALRLTALMSALLLLTGCAAVPEKLELFCMDTVMELTAYGENAKEALSECANELVRLDKLFSVNEKTSDIYKINISAGKRVKISEETAELIKTANGVSEITGGALDISVYPVSRLWGFTTGSYTVPQDGEIASALKNVGCGGIEIGSGTVRLKEGMALDLGAIAKGYASQRAAEILSDNGITSAVISLGGNVQTVNSKPDGGKWRIGIRDPNGGVFATVSSYNEAIVTSGGYLRCFEENGRTYHHIIDPHTGYPADSGLSSVTVICDNGVLADALSTALYVLGYDGSMELYDTYGGFEAIFLTDDGQVRCTKGICGRVEKYGDGGGYAFEQG